MGTTQSIPLTWGPWRYRSSTFTLDYTGPDHHYWVDLRKCTTSAQALDRIAQVATKTWCTPATLGYLVQAMNDLLRFQSRLCGSGQSHEVEAAKMPQLIDRAARAKRASLRWKAECAASEPRTTSSGLQIRMLSDFSWDRLAELRREEGLA